MIAIVNVLRKDRIRIKSFVIREGYLYIEM